MVKLPGMGGRYPHSCLAVNGNASPWRARWLSSPGCSSLTSPLVLWDPMVRLSAGPQSSYMFSLLCSLAPAG